MKKYILKRILLAVLTFLIICAVSFFVMHLVPGGPFNKAKALSQSTIDALNARYNLDKPVWVQFLLYMKGLLKGDLGLSLKNGRPITEIFAESFPISIALGLAAIVLALVLGTVLGSIAALKRGKWQDRLILFLSTALTAIPSFILAVGLLTVFCINLKWFPIWSIEQPNYILPILTLAAYPMAYTTRIARTSMLDALGQDYIRTAKAKGASRNGLLFRHALRNSLIPIISFAGPEIAYIITGSTVVESIFTIGGIGSKFVTAISARDYTMIMATTILLATLMIIANLVTDILYKVADPRIKYE